MSLVLRVPAEDSTYHIPQAVRILFVLSHIPMNNQVSNRVQQLDHPGCHYVHEGCVLAKDNIMASSSLLVDSVILRRAETLKRITMPEKTGSMQLKMVTWAPDHRISRSRWCTRLMHHYCCSPTEA